MAERIVSRQRWGQRAIFLLKRWPRPQRLIFWAVFIFFSNQAVLRGQVVGDQTLPANSAVSTQDGLLYQIDQGTTRGRNLFHSFERFSVPSGGEARFNNSASVENIISRVTGGSISNVDGLIKANGNANFFFLNPNGIIFGPNSSLDIGGSFIASNAASLDFSDGSSFSAVEPQTSSLLTISTPVGLQLGENPASISSQSSIMNSLLDRTGLGVSPDLSLFLMGGNVMISTGRIDLIVQDQRTLRLQPNEKNQANSRENEIIQINSRENAVNPMNLRRFRSKIFSEDFAAVCTDKTGKESRLSRFFVSGRGGLSPDPNGNLSQDAVVANWALRQSKNISAAKEDARRNRQSSKITVAKLQTRIVEAHGWHITADGDVALTTQPLEISEAVAQKPGPSHPICARNFANDKA
ncbi:hypothetical protein C1752_01176 [Acaryochloris thomasi RCC1774]|uniref:Filamentous haemagglutinin FhaB/tRNA nuclease CdiA-like TPS domain-containing protein n=2 Tax=Acaryochloris TaxID=155977 RepID=A0A2W1JLE3_9CYAN|nr:hypothetical protein C1752_01176 [Acaryochloris thomasi RCC1774]